MTESTYGILPIILLGAGVIVLLFGLFMVIKRKPRRWLWVTGGIILILSYTYLFDPDFFSSLY